MPCQQKNCACKLLGRTKKERVKCRFNIVSVSKFHGKRKRIKIDPRTGKRIDNNKNDE